MKHLFITDLDGTLLTPESHVSAESARIISELSRKGALITVATARTPATVEPLLRDTLTTIPAIVLTGASMWDRSTLRFLNPALLPDDVEPELSRRFREYGVNPFVYTLNKHGDGMTVFHCEELTLDEKQFYAERKELPLKNFVFGDKDACVGIAHPRTMLLLGIGETPILKSLADDLGGDPRLSVSAYPDIFNPDRSYIEVFRSGISKALAVSRLKEMTGADRVTVYGDSINDLSMFAVADESVAVANAMPEVLSAATRVIGSNTLPSVADDMRRIYYSCGNRI